MNKYLVKISSWIKEAEIYPRHAYREHAPERLDKIENPIATVKYDGASFWVPIDEEGKPKFISRRISVRGTPIDRTTSLPHLSDIRLPQYAGHILNVELIHNDWDKDAPESHNKVSGILNSLPERAIRTQKETGPVRAVLFDIIEPKLGTYKEKLERMKEIEKAAGKPDLFFVPKVVEGIDAINKLADETKKKKHEGLIITSLTASEDKNPRYKLKHYGTYNLKVVDMTQLVDKNGKTRDELGALIVADRNGKVVANVGSGFTPKQRKEIWKNKGEWIDRIIQVKTFGYVTNRLRAPIFQGFADTNVADRVP